MGSVPALSASWSDTNLWPAVRTTPFVAVLAGIDRSGIVDAALADAAVTGAVLLRFEPPCTPPCDALLWRLETSSGEGLNQSVLLRRCWHRSPYALTLRLVQYQPGSVVPEVLDEGTLGTRGPYAAFKATVDRLVMRFVRDAALGRSRGPAGALPAVPAHGMPGWLDAFRARWRDRLTTEWWSVGTVTAPMDQVLGGAGLGKVTWSRPTPGDRYLADPFPWPGTGRILCEEMPLTGGVGRIVCVDEINGTATQSTVLLEDGNHHSYPCTYCEDGTVYCVPESPERGTTCIYRLEDDGRLIAVCEPAPLSRLADPTLFRLNGRYWLACTDLDLGGQDNLCLLYATAIKGPWKAHARWPVKTDVRSARPAGMLFKSGGRLFRPGQDCAATYGAGVAIHEILVLNENEFRESLVTVLRPDPSGPFPHGLHTLVHDGERFWLDGKRFIFDLGLLRQKLRGRASRMLSGMGVR